MSNTPHHNAPLPWWIKLLWLTTLAGIVSYVVSNW